MRPTHPRDPLPPTPGELARLYGGAPGSPRRRVLESVPPPPRRRPQAVLVGRPQVLAGGILALVLEP